MKASKSYAEIVMKSGAVISFECTSVTWTQNRNLMGEVTEASLKWDIPEGAQRRPVHFDLKEIAAVIFVDGTSR